MSIEWESLILGGNELKTVGPATENARRANSHRRAGRTAEERWLSASVWPAQRRSTCHGDTSKICRKRYTNCC